MTEEFIEATLEMIHPRLTKSWSYRKQQLMRPIVFMVSRPDLDKGLDDGMFMFLGCYRKLAQENVPKWKRPILLILLATLDDGPYGLAVRYV